jgi:amidase
MVHGPLSRTVRDTAAWFAATESQHPAAPFQPVGVVSGPVARKLRIGVRQALPHTGAKPAPAVQTVFDASAARLARLGHDVREAPLAYDGPVAAPAYMDLWEGRMARFLAGLAQQAGHELTAADIEPRLLSMAAHGRNVSDARMAECLNILRVAAGRHAGQFDAYDVYMTPVFATEPIRIGELGPNGDWADQRPRLLAYACYCWIDNLAGTPAITLPMGFSPRGLPIGIQFSAAPGDERVLLELAYQLEDEMAWWRRRPPVWVASASDDLSTRTR